ncbi:uncharacterized protein LOC106070292 [Biomphalaria glabrata]|uniref:Uncharacterized protein LOC106070292 n=1 Tax=Biomphalaria glabrata TaxID=6526 RepID=A0A9W2YK69_BIOGL|nr:uncharacterized protein LOC106070292 [Biomphalaria glabrata]XP_013085601.2 uncharacterized protein LOC106070292 [Biomphalaria glabrata]XP_055863178.1 uncharacterized protein LOC106070292 [Biomphalaria glabrata]XP_055863179.1 uncharacterized protein LOC106070292 [Biomphalaria glabrata]
MTTSVFTMTTSAFTIILLCITSSVGTAQSNQTQITPGNRTTSSPTQVNGKTFPANSATISVNSTELCKDTSSFVVDTRTVLYVQSPNFGSSNRYPNNLQCFLELKTQTHAVVIEFKFIAFDVQLSENCQADSLCMYGVKFCGDWLVDRYYRYIIPENSSFTLVFISDGDIPAPGFKAMIQASPATAEKVFFPVGGFGSHPTQPYFTTKVYNEAYVTSYKDRCVAAKPETT